MAILAYSDGAADLRRGIGSGLRLGLLTPNRLSGRSKFCGSALGTNGLSGVCTEGR